MTLSNNMIDNQDRIAKFFDCRAIQYKHNNRDMYIHDINVDNLTAAMLVHSMLESLSLHMPEGSWLFVHDPDWHVPYRFAIVHDEKYMDDLTDILRTMDDFGFFYDTSLELPEA